MYAFIFPFISDLFGDCIKCCLINLTVRSDDDIFAAAVDKMHGVRAACILVDEFGFIVTGFCVPGDRDCVFCPLAPTDDLGRFSENGICPCCVDHLCLLLGGAVFPLRNIVAELIQMEDGKGIAMERSD